jgi:hypothetical protein
MKNIKNRITILKKHKSKATNKNNDSNNDSNNDICLSNDSNNNNSINSNINENECLICLEVKNNNNEKTMKLNDLACEKYCECDGWIHKTCLDSWFKIKFTCPICRNSISSFNPQHQIHYYGQHQRQRQGQGHIIHTSLTSKDYFIIIISAIFIYCFYFS